MKKILSILLAVLVIGACATTDASAKQEMTDRPVIDNNALPADVNTN